MIELVVSIKSILRRCFENRLAVRLDNVGEGVSLDQHGPKQVEGTHATNVKSLRWLSPCGSAGHNEIKIVK